MFSTILGSLRDPELMSAMSIHAEVMLPGHPHQPIRSSLVQVQGNSCKSSSGNCKPKVLDLEALQQKQESETLQLEKQRKKLLDDLFSDRTYIRDRVTRSQYEEFLQSFAPPDLSQITKLKIQINQINDDIQAQEKLEEKRKELIEALFLNREHDFIGDIPRSEFQDEWTNHHLEGAVETLKKGGCTVPAADNYDAKAQHDNGTCRYTCVVDDRPHGSTALAEALIREAPRPLAIRVDDTPISVDDLKGFCNEFCGHVGLPFATFKWRREVETDLEFFDRVTIRWDPADALGPLADIRTQMRNPCKSAKPVRNDQLPEFARGEEGAGPICTAYCTLKQNDVRSLDFSIHAKHFDQYREYLDDIDRRLNQ